MDYVNIISDTDRAKIESVLDHNDHPVFVDMEEVDSLQAFKVSVLASKQ